MCVCVGGGGGGNYVKKKKLPKNISDCKFKLFSYKYLPNVIKKNLCFSMNYRDFSVKPKLIISLFQTVKLSL